MNKSICLPSSELFNTSTASKASAGKPKFTNPKALDSGRRSLVISSAYYRFVKLGSSRASILVIASFDTYLKGSKRIENQLHQHNFRKKKKKDLSKILRKFKKENELQYKLVNSQKVYSEDRIFSSSQLALYEIL